MGNDEKIFHTRRLRFYQDKIDEQSERKQGLNTTWKMKIVFVY